MMSQGKRGREGSSSHTYTEEILKIPENVDVDVSHGVVTVRGPKGELSRKLLLHGTQIIKDGRTIRVFGGIRRKEKAIVGTVAAHIRNMITGVTQGFEYKLKICYSHFPMQVSVSGNEVVISNFMGEKAPRRARIVGSAKVEVRGDIVTVSGINIEEVGQTAANIERATRIKERDPRVFQDGIYIFDRGK